MLTPGQTINICHILPTQFHFYCRFPYRFVPRCVLFVCLLVAYAMGQTHTPSQTASPRNNEALLCLVFFFSPDPRTCPYWAGEDWEGLRFCLCSPLWGICRGAVEGSGSTAHIGAERNPTWVEWEQRSPRKHWTSKTKHFLWKWIYLLAWLPEEPRQNGFLMGNRETLWGLPKDLHEKHSIWSRGEKNKSDSSGLLN